MKRTAIALVFVAALAGSVATTLIQAAWASRNSSGSYSLPAGNPVVTRTAISATAFNATMTDLAAEITNSLDRQGRGGMNAPLPLSSGSAAAPSLTFSSGTTDGLYRVGSHDVGFALNGAEVAHWMTTGLGITIANPASTVALTNTLTAKNLPKVWGLITTNGSGGCSVADGLNITSCAVAAGGDVTVTFASAFANTNYAIFGTASSGGPRAFYVFSAATGSMVFRVYLADLATERDCSTNACTVSYEVMGAQ